MGIKIENLKTTEFTANFPTPNGFVKPYSWKGVRGKRRSILEVPEEVHEWLLYHTSTFKKGYLILAAEEDNEDIIEEMKNVETPVILYTVEEIKSLLTGKIAYLKKKLNDKSDKETILEFVNVAKEIKLDSDSVKTYLATLLGHKENKEIIFPIEE